MGVVFYVVFYVDQRGTMYRYLLRILCTGYCVIIVSCVVAGG